MTPRKPTTRTLQLLDGGAFRIGARTRTIDLHNTLGMPLDIAFLHLNESTAALELRPVPGGTPRQVMLPRGGPVPRKPVPMGTREWNCRVELPAVVAFLGPDSKQLPAIMKRMAKHVAAMPEPQYAWQPGQATGFPGRGSWARQTLWVVHEGPRRGECWLEQIVAGTTPKAATTPEAFHVVQLPPTVASVWLLVSEYAAMPAALVEAIDAARAQRDKGATDDAPGRRKR